MPTASQRILIEFFQKDLNITPTAGQVDQFERDLALVSPSLMRALGTKRLMLLSRCEMPVRFVERKFMMSARSKLADENTGSLLTQKESMEDVGGGCGRCRQGRRFGSDVNPSPDSN